MHFFVLQGTAKVVDNVQKNKLTPYSLAAVNAQIKVDIFCQKKTISNPQEEEGGKGGTGKNETKSKTVA